MNKDVGKTGPDLIDEVVDSIDAMNERQLRCHCRLIEMIGQQQMCTIRELEDKVRKLSEDKLEIKTILSAEIDRSKRIESDRKRDMSVHKAVMFDLIAFGILMIVCIACITSAAVI